MYLIPFPTLNVSYQDTEEIPDKALKIQVIASPYINIGGVT